MSENIYDVEKLDNSLQKISTVMYGSKPCCGASTNGPHYYWCEHSDNQNEVMDKLMDRIEKKEKDMNRREAMEALLNGQCIRHQSWNPATGGPAEYVYLGLDGCLKNEDGDDLHSIHPLSANQPNDGWRIFYKVKEEDEDSDTNESDVIYGLDKLTEKIQKLENIVERLDMEVGELSSKSCDCSNSEHLQKYVSHAQQLRERHANEWDELDSDILAGP